MKPCMACRKPIRNVPRYLAQLSVEMVCDDCVQARGPRMWGDELEAAKEAIRNPIADYGRAAKARAAAKKRWEKEGKV